MVLNKKKWYKLLDRIPKIVQTAKLNFRKIASNSIFGKNFFLYLKLNSSSSFFILVHPSIKDKSAFDAIANYNDVVLKAELAVENNKDTKFKNLLHEDGIFCIV